MKTISEWKATFFADRGYWFLLLPLMLFLGVFFLYPLFGMLTQSLFDPGFTLKNYFLMIKYPVYFRIFWNTFEMSTGVTLICVVFGYPVAMYLSGSKSTWVTIFLIAILLPFWISVLVRTYSWMIILGRHGLINELLQALGVTDHPIKLMYNRIGVYIGMIYFMLPYTILPMMSVMGQIDRTLLRAAENLGATPWQAFRHVFFPLSLPGVGAAVILSFMICVGFYVTPALMGGPQDTMVAMSIYTQIEEIKDWGFASAQSTLLLAAVLILFMTYIKFFGLGTLLGRNVAPSISPLTAGASGAVKFKGLFSRIHDAVWTDERIGFIDTLRLKSQDGLQQVGRLVSNLLPGFVARIAWSGLFLKLILGSVFVFMVAPVFLLFPMAFSNDTMLQFPPKEWGLGLFKQYFSSNEWIKATLNSFYVAFPVMIISTILGTLASLSLIRGRFKGKQFYYALFLAPIIIPQIINALASYFFFSKFQLIGTIFCLVIAHTALAVPFVVVVMTAVLEGFDERLEMASMNLGAGRIRTFFNVTFPILRPGLMSAALLAFIRSFDEIVVAMFLCGVMAKTLPKQMWEGIRDEINPIISAVAVLLIGLSILLMVMNAILRRRAERLQV
jgi:putative spermidine/putrescine transport system permease protein